MMLRKRLEPKGWLQGRKRVLLRALRIALHEMIYVVRFHGALENLANREQN